MKRLTHESELVGKTIRSLEPCVYGGGRVLVFEDNDWCVLEAYGFHCDEMEVRVDSYGLSLPVTHFLNPHQLLDAGLVNHPQYELLIAQERDAKALRLREQQARIASELAELQPAGASS
jgi:hypothetical protein